MVVVQEHRASDGRVAHGKRVQQQLDPQVRLLVRLRCNPGGSSCCYRNDNGESCAIRDANNAPGGTASRRAARGRPHCLGRTQAPARTVASSPPVPAAPDSSRLGRTFRGAGRHAADFNRRKSDNAIPVCTCERIGRYQVNIRQQRQPHTVRTIRGGSTADQPKPANSCTGGWGLTANICVLVP